MEIRLTPDELKELLLRQEEFTRAKVITQVGCMIDTVLYNKLADGIKGIDLYKEMEQGVQEMYDGNVKEKLITLIP
jgi:hypothetical protein